MQTDAGRRIRYLCVLLIVPLAFDRSLHSAERNERKDTFREARHEMVRRHIESAGIKNERVLQSMRSTPRHRFVSKRQRKNAYFDMALPIGNSQTISPPYIVAFMTDQLDPQADDRVLEIGTGSGYQAAVLSSLVKDVYSIEIVEPLGKRAAKVLRDIGYDNIFTKVGDGFQGWPERAPFDKIIVTCSPESIPQPLVDQLAEGGKLIIPLGERFQQTLCRFTKVGGELRREPLQATFFVPMTGTAEDKRIKKPEPTRPKIVHGDFEQNLEGTSEPKGWYYIRQAEIVDDANSPGGSCLKVSNETENRAAHCLQSFGIDGRVVKKISVKFWSRGENIRLSRSPQKPPMVIEFYGENRAPVGRREVGPWKGSFDWRERTITVRPPQRARLAVMGIGLFGSTGSIWFDDIRVSIKE